MKYIMDMDKPIVMFTNENAANAFAREFEKVSSGTPGSERIFDGSGRMTLYRCPHCKKPLKRSRLPQYDFECLDCDEDFYECEAIEDEVLFRHFAPKPKQSN